MSYTMMTFLGITFTFLMATLGASVVFFFKKQIPSSLNAIFLGFSSGVMLAASIWSLLLPALESAKNGSFATFSFLPAAVGLLFGGLFLWLLDKLSKYIKSRKNPLSSNLSKAAKLFIAMTVHNIPEGLAVGFAFGGIQSGNSVSAALGLAIGMGIQNIPEGAAVALPLRESERGRGKCFLFSLLSSIVEPLSAIAGYFLAANLQFAQPWLLAFAAGTMLYVVCEELLPDIGESEHRQKAAWSALLGFVLMMILDVALG